jgi:hypothetical protein
MGSSEEPDGSDVRADGPPDVRPSIIDEHAEQFDEDLPERRAGSQQEFAAATYLTGHLQRAGYEVRLASVPFKDLVRSTNVVALPPGGEPISAVVAVLYDTGPDTPPNGRDLGLFLELARALRVRAPGHHVQFVALGAETTGESGGNLGSKILASELQDSDPVPPVVALIEVPGGGFSASGPGGDELDQISSRLDIRPARPPGESLFPVYLRAADVFSGAEIPYSIAAGGSEEVATVVLDYLEAR